MCDKRYLKAIYATANKYGLVERILANPSTTCGGPPPFNKGGKLGGKLGCKSSGVAGDVQTDALHTIVYTLTGKASIRDLTDGDARSVLHELQKYEPVGKGKMTNAQIRKAWAVYYRLKELTPGTASDGERMCGIIKKVTGINAVTRTPFKWLSADDGEKVIEYLKRYVRSAESKKNKRR